MEAIRGQGFSVVANAIDDAFMAEIRAELDRLQELRPGGDLAPAPFSGYVTRRWFDLLNDAEVWQRVAVHPAVLAVLPRILGDGFLLSHHGLRGDRSR